MNYRHLYHAGNSVDVIKHCILISLLELISKKEKPWFYLETHAGIGKYDLTATEAIKTNEAADGIKKIWAALPEYPALAHYLSIISKLNPDNTLRYYPGSPYIAEQCARTNDKLVFCELHTEDFLILKKNLKKTTQIHFQACDGYAALKALLPPTPARGLVFIDPPYEKEDEMQSIVTHLKLALKRWPHGCYAIWYPIKDQLAIKKFKNQCHAAFKTLTIKSIEVITRKPINQHLIGSGMLIINPPFELDIKLKLILNALLSLLSDGHGSIEVA